MACETCEWHTYFYRDKSGAIIEHSDGILKCVKNGWKPCIHKCDRYERQEYPVPRSEWRGPTWNY